MGSTDVFLVLLLGSFLVDAAALFISTYLATMLFVESYYFYWPVSGEAKLASLLFSSLTLASQICCYWLSSLSLSWSGWFVPLEFTRAVDYDLPAFGLGVFPYCNLLYSIDEFADPLPIY